MDLKGKKIGFGFTGSHCTYSEVLPQLEKLVELGADVYPIVTHTVKATNTRFGEGEDIVKRIEEIAGKEVIDSIVKAEPFGPSNPLDCVVIAPLTGNSLSKLSSSQIDSPVLMAAKATLRNLKPVVVGVSTNDALGLNGVNIMKLMATKNIYFIPFGQDDPFKKPTSMVAKMDLLTESVIASLSGKQYQPVIIERY